MDHDIKTGSKSDKTLKKSGMLIGVGMGGFLDGIFFHQILQIHNMLSHRIFPDTLVNEQINMFWDGLFHLATWTVTASGIYFLWRAAQEEKFLLRKNTFIGSMLFGWGAFNLIEGIIDHHIFEIHHVVQRATGATQIFWDLAFLSSGALLVIFGLWIRRRDEGKLNEPLSQNPVGKFSPSRA